MHFAFSFCRPIANDKTENSQRENSTDTAPTQHRHTRTHTPTTSEDRWRNHFHRRCDCICTATVRSNRSQIINWRIFKSFSFSLQSQWLGAAAVAEASRLIVVTVENSKQIEKKIVTWLFNKVTATCRQRQRFARHYLFSFSFFAVCEKVLLSWTYWKVFVPIKMSSVKWIYRY